MTDRRSSRPSGPGWRAWPTACWARSPRPRTWRRTPGCAGAAPEARDDRRSGRLAGRGSTTRLCLDRLAPIAPPARGLRGPWLPEPLVEDLTEDPLERAEEVSVAFLLALERLSPLERAVFLLQDVFDADYGAVAEALGRSEAACRQLAARARLHLASARPRFPSAGRAARLAAAFMDAAPATTRRPWPSCWPRTRC